MKATISFTIAIFGALLSSGLVSATPIPGSEKAKRCSPLNTVTTYDANNSNITYSSGWTMLTNQGTMDKDGVEAFSNSPCAYYTVQVPIEVGSIEIYAAKKVDRGFFDVYIGDTYFGTGDTYDSACSSNCQSAMVYSATMNGTTNYQNQTLTVRNRQADSRLDGKTPYLDVNYLSFPPPSC